MATPLHTVDTRHDDMIHDAQLDYYGRRLATCSSDRKVKVFDVTGDKKTLIAELAGHTGPVWEVSWAHPKFGVLLASCSYDTTVIIHREQSDRSWAPVHSHSDHTSSVNSVAWAPHEYGLVLAAASSDGRVSVVSHGGDDRWKTTSIADCALGVNAVTWAPATHIGSKDGAAMVQRIATAGCDGNVRVYKSVGGGEWVADEGSAGILSYHRDWVRDVAWAHATGMSCNIMASCSEDCTVAIWKQDKAGGAWSPTALPKFSAPVWRVSWSITGNILAVSSGDASVTLWKETLAGKWVEVTTVGEEAGSGGGGGGGGGSGAGVETK